MHSLSIFFGPSPVPAQFLFKDKEKVMAVITTFKNETTLFEFNDDFGQWGFFKRPEVHGMTIEDMNLGEESRIQRGLSQARGQANANKRAMSDPVIMAAQRGQGPSVLTPFGNGRFNG